MLWAEGFLGGSYILPLLLGFAAETVLIEYLPVRLLSEEAGGLLSMIFWYLKFVGLLTQEG